MRPLGWTLIAIAMCSCAAPPPKDGLAGVSPPRMADIGDIDFTRRTEIALLNDQGTKLSVGDDIERAQDLFPKRGAKGFADLPPTLNSQVFNAWGWQTTHGEAFGAIFERRARRVALAMRTMPDQGQLALDDLINRFRREIGSTAAKELGVPAGPIRYWFWTRSSMHRLMVCAVTNKKGGYNVTVAMGDVQVMDAIGADPEKAAVDLAKATNVLERKKSATTGT